MHARSLAIPFLLVPLALVVLALPLRAGFEERYRLRAKARPEDAASQYLLRPGPMILEVLGQVAAGSGGR